MQCKKCESTNTKIVLEDGQTVVRVCEDCGEYFSQSLARVVEGNSNRLRRGVKNIKPLADICEDLSPLLNSEKEWTREELLKELDKFTDAATDLIVQTELAKKEVEALTTEELEELLRDLAVQKEGTSGIGPRVGGLEEPIDEEEEEDQSSHSVGMTLSEFKPLENNAKGAENTPEMEYDLGVDGLKISGEEADALINQILFGEGE